MKIEESLQYIGLSKAESLTYQSLLTLGEASIHEIAAASAIERTYCYKIMAKLESLGLCHQTSRSPLSWVAEDPEVLEQVSASHHQQLISVAKELGRLAKSGKSAQVRVIDSVDELRAAYTKLLEKATRADSIYNPGILERHLPGLSAVYVGLLDKNFIHSRDLIAGEIDIERFAGLAKSPLRKNEIRPLKGQAHLATEITITDTDALLVGYTPAPHGVLISNSALASLLRGLFEVMWESATEKSTS